MDLSFLLHEKQFFPAAKCDLGMFFRFCFFLAIHPW